MREFFNCEIRASTEDARTVEGVALRYDDVSKHPWGEERFEPGSLNCEDVILNFNHDRGRPLARTGGGGLQIMDSKEELSFKAELPDTETGRDCFELVKRGVLRGASVEFFCEKEEYQKEMRVITLGTLYGVAIVDRPAFPQSYVEARTQQKIERERKVLRFFL